MTGCDPKVKNVTVIHLAGSPNSAVIDREIVHNGNNIENEITNNGVKVGLKYIDSESNLFNDHFNSRNIYENLRYYYAPLESQNEIQLQNAGSKISLGSEQIYEKCPCHFDDDSLIGPYSLLSVHESIIESCNSCQHYTTITIGQRNLINIDLDSLRGPKIYFEDTRPKLKHSHASQTDLMRPIMKNKELQVNLDNNPSYSLNVDRITHQNMMKLHHVTYNTNFKNKICEKYCFDTSSHDAEFDKDSVSSFSSAYTVTECELAASDTSSNAFYHKSFSKACDKQQNDDDWKNDTDLYQTWNPAINSVTNIFQNETYIPKYIGKDKIPLFTENERKKWGKKFNKQFIYEEMLNYLFAQLEQKDKSEDEIWISNEATFSSNVANKNVDLPLHFAIPPSVFPQINPKVQGSESTDHGGKFNKRLSAVAFDQRERADASFSAEDMTAFFPTIACDLGVHRNHFTNRQRITESPSNHEYGKDFWNKENRMNEVTKEVKLSAQLTSTVDNRPTKRFSFLVRSNNTTGELNVHPGNPSTNNKTTGDKISPSDKAILDRLSELNITSPSSLVSKQPQPTKTTQKSPTCGRCGDLVYPQELVKPTDELYFHSACFKCQQCGIKLNLRTFFRCASPTKDNRIFCRGHLPTSDIRKVNSDNITTVDSKDIVKCDPVGLRYF